MLRRSKGGLDGDVNEGKKARCAPYSLQERALCVPRSRFFRLNTDKWYIVPRVASEAKIGDRICSGLKILFDAFVVVLLTSTVFSINYNNKKDNYCFEYKKML